ncbi:hypothetical protein ABTW96_23605 [Nocardia beijingensis]|uniref:hypothetical protein n=1 Tax=Nocardia beijingensis TaxID=95162 RepID=UPI00332B9850
MTQRIVFWNVPQDQLPTTKGDVTSVDLSRAGLLAGYPELEKALDGGKILSHSTASLGADRIVVSFVVEDR